MQLDRGLFCLDSEKIDQVQYNNAGRSRCAKVLIAHLQKIYIFS
jgi:hypothetical protein